tara:strand:+ start:304 stop:1656 length:1353 start_codon:yes stop_codon:yes gene_type:complete
MVTLKQRQSQKQSLSPSQVLSASILQLNISNLEQKILDELEKNPILDQNESEPEKNSDAEDDNSVDFEEDPNEYEPANIYEKKESNDFDGALPQRVDFIENLIFQLDEFNLSEWERLIAEEVLWNLDEKGYLAIDPILIADRYDSTEEKVMNVIKKVQKLEPLGVAALNLQDCLLIQIQDKKENSIVFQILSNHFKDFVNNRFEILQKKLSISREDLAMALDKIKKLNPKPGEGKFDIDVESVIPDLVILQYENSWKIIVNDSWMPELTLNQEYVSMLDQTDVAIDTKKYLKEKFNSANWFIDAIEQRRKTLASVMKAIINRQSSFFKDGTGDIRPMKLQDIANDIQMDISTISRSTRGKYVDTPFGIYELKSFFSEGYTLDSGDTISTKTIKQLLKELIENENKNSPLTDTDLAKQLKSKGYPVARRTVAKYRENLQFPIAKLRRELIH